MSSSLYDVIIVGAGIAGSALAHALATLPRLRPLRIAVVERSLAEPDRIVGELLQPGGMAALRELGMDSSVDNIDAVTVRGYLVVENGQAVRIPYPEGNEGRSFHHGRFIMALRSIAKRNRNVDLMEGTVTDLLECPCTKRVIGVRVATKDQATKAEGSFSVFASIVIVADGCFSNFRNTVLGENACTVTTKSYFVGTILKDAVLPAAQHGTVILAEGHQPILLYQISQHDTRMLIDMQHPLPADLKTHILCNILPTIPPSLQGPVHAAFSENRIRRMPNSFLPPIKQGGKATKEGVILIGDSWNMRHPLTGGGMTVALNDVVYLSRLLHALPDFEDWDNVSRALNSWHWQRKPLCATINLLSGTLYGLFGEHTPAFLALRKGCFKYFLLGGRCISGPVALLSGLAPSPPLLVSHFFSVIFYSIWVAFTHQTSQPSKASEDQSVVDILNYYLGLISMAVRMFLSAFSVFSPILWSELRWWAPKSR